MNGQLYFEEQPWERACSLIAQQEFGKIHQIIAQCVCPKGRLQETLRLWKQRVEELAGPERQGNLLEAGRALSYIGTFGDGTIVRFFFDDAAADVSENFEIVTEKSLMVWKPINTNQGHLMAEDSYFIESSQRYVADLAAGPA